MEEIADLKQLDHLLGRDLAVIFKHSTQCGMSDSAYRQMEAFSSDHPQVPMGIVHVIESREVSDEIERRTGVHHESPEVVLLRRGKVIFWESHSRVTAQNLERALGMRS